MLFNSIDFLIFFPIVLLVYFIIPQKAKTFWLLLASYYFYMSWNAQYAILILLSTIITYLSGLLLERVKKADIEQEKKLVRMKLVVAGSFVTNLGILFYFKYFNFFMELIEDILKSWHIKPNMPYFDIILPVGISFYTFQALSYTMDVYRDDIYAEKNFIRYALFVSFFPQLVAGPIERSKNLLKQLAVTHKFSYENAREGLLLMLWGFFLKLVIADRVSVYVDRVYSDLDTYGGMYIVVASLLFAVQIYCDFFGYSVIAMGAAKMLGIELMENFNAPFYATSFDDLWRRWHISLTSWFRDYLYFPLGGSRKGMFRKQINKIIVFAVSGLWHGARMSYVVWGIISGIFQVISELSIPFRNKAVAILKLNRDSLGHILAKRVVTFLLFCFTDLFFRASTFAESIKSIKSIITVHNPWILFDGSLYELGVNEKNFRLMLLAIFVLMFADYFKYKGIKIREVVIKQDLWFRALFIAVAIAVILTFGVWGSAYEAANFIYFQF